MATRSTAIVATGSLYLRSTYFESEKLVEELESLFQLDIKPERRESRGMESMRSSRLGLSPSQAASALGVSLGTIRRWADVGYLESYRTPGGQRRFSVQQIEQFLKELEARRAERERGEQANGESERSLKSPTLEDPRPPNLSDVAAAITQTERYIRAAEILSRTDWPDGDPTRARFAEFARSAASLTARPTTAYRVASVQMDSPLKIVLHLSPADWVAIAGGLVLLAERISTLGPRVSRTRKRALLEAAVYDAARRDLLAGRADGLAFGCAERRSGGRPGAH